MKTGIMYENDLSKMKWDLQLFADDDGEEPETDEDYEAPPEDDYDDYSDDSSEELTEDPETGKTVTQEELNRVIEKRLARERKKQEKQLKETFGTNDLKQAAEYYQAGMAVAQRAGVKPRDVLSRLRGQQGQGQNPQDQSGYQNQGDEDMREELNEIKNMLATQHQQEMMAKEESAAKKEFGELFDKHREDIVERAEDDGLSLVDAAAVVLRPELKNYYNKRMQSKQENMKKKRVDRTNEGPAKSGEDVGSKLNAEQLRVAKKMGITPKKYYERLKKAGRID